MRLDEIEHFLKIRYKEQEIISNFGTCGLNP